MAGRQDDSGRDMLQLRGVTWDHPRGYAPLVASVAPYREQHSAFDIQWDKRSLRDFEDFPVEDLAASYDLLMVDHPFMGVAAARKCLLPLDTLLLSSVLQHRKEQSVGPSYMSYTYDGHQWALPADAAAQVVAYRPDLLNSLPTSWVDVAELARERANAKKSRVAIPLNAVHALCSFFTLCANWGEPVCQRPDAMVSITMGGRVLTWLSSLVTVLHPCSLDWDPPRLLDRMAETDEIAYSPLVFGYVNYGRPGFRPHLVRFGNLPSSGRGPVGSVLGGVGIAISARCRQPSEAANYIEWLTGPSVQGGIYFEEGGQPGNLLAWLDHTVNADSTRFFLDTLNTLEHAYLRPRYDGFIRFQVQAGEIIHRFLRNGGNIESVLGELNALYVASREG